jgi:steroid 5-alpha reductase family enzyme
MQKVTLAILAVIALFASCAVAWYVSIWEAKIGVVGRLLPLAEPESSITLLLTLHLPCFRTGAPKVMRLLLLSLKV